MGNLAPATEVMEMTHKLRAPANDMNVVPGVNETLVSGVKMAEADYITVLDKKNVKVYDGKTTYILPTNKPVLQGYWCKHSRLWRIPLKEKIENENTDTKLIQCPDTTEAIANVFELPTVKKQIAYYHAAAGFPVQSTWVDAVKLGSYATWQGLTPEAIRKHYPKTNATQEGYMHGLRQGIKSTKPKDKKTSNEASHANNALGKPTPATPLAKEHDFFTRVVDLQETIYTN